jgi:hypothetical protein
MRRTLVLALVVLAITCATAGDKVIPSGPYCVSVAGLGRIDVPLHTPDLAKLDELRGSMRNALALLINQAEVRAADDPARAEVARALKDRLAKGVRFSFETEATRYQKGGQGEIVCTCSTLVYDPTVVGRGFCAGACGDCFSCK